jgi:uncharacterized protein (UPF0212 family)
MSDPMSYARASVALVGDDKEAQIYHSIAIFNPEFNLHKARQIAREAVGK